MIIQRQWIGFLMKHKALIIIGLIGFYFFWNYFFKNANQKKENCNFAYSPEIFGEWFEDKNILKSKIPIVYYFNGNSIPEWALLNIRNTLRFHEKVYFVSRDGLQVTFDGVMYDFFFFHFISF